MLLCSNFIDGTIGCGHLAWVIMGLVYRWKFIGKVCSGDFVPEDKIEDYDQYAWKSGKFMKIYLYVVIGVPLGLMLAACLGVCCYKICSKESSQ